LPRPKNKETKRIKTRLPTLGVEESFAFYDHAPAGTGGLRYYFMRSAENGSCLCKKSFGGTP
jgi:hypothetical protein